MELRKEIIPPILFLFSPWVIYEVYFAFLFRHVHSTNTIVVSVLAGVPASKIGTAFDTKMVLRPSFDINRLPICWEDEGCNTSNVFLDFHIDNREAYLRHAAEELKACPGALEQLVQTLRTYAVRSSLMKEDEALAVVRDIVYGRPAHGERKLPIDQEVEELRHNCQYANANTSNKRGGAPPRTYMQIELFDTLRSCSKHKVLPPFQRCFRA